MKKCVFEEYQRQKASNTLRRHQADLTAFARYVNKVTSLQVKDLDCSPIAWQHITWQMVEGFAKWQLLRGHSAQSVNVRLSTIRTYARLAGDAGHLDSTQVKLIRAIKGFPLPPRQPKEQIRLSDAQVEELKHNQPLTPQGRRDTVLLCLLLDHGLRVKDIAALTIANFDLAEGTMILYRSQIDSIEIHKLTENTWQALEAYAELDSLAIGPLLRQSRKSGELTNKRMTAQSIAQRVKNLGIAKSIDGLTVHDCRQYWLDQVNK